MGFSYALMWAPFQEDFLSEKISPGDTVFDIGANRGQTALLFAQEVGSSGQVIAFEPVEELAELISENTGLNDFQNVDTINAAACSEEGEVAFEYSEEQSTRGSISRDEDGDGETIEVQAVTLDSIAERRGYPDFLKIDVEGEAGEVIRGAPKVLRREPNIYIEIHGENEKRAVKKGLLKRGYTAWTLDGRKASAIPNGGPLWLKS